MSLLEPKTSFEAQEYHENKTVTHRSCKWLSSGSNFSGFHWRRRTWGLLIEVAAPASLSSPGTPQYQGGELCSRRGLSGTCRPWTCSTAARRWSPPACCVWECETVGLWRCDTVTLWHYDTMRLWDCETVRLRDCGTVRVWECGTPPQYWQVTSVSVLAGVGTAPLSVWAAQ